jgi:acetyl-CoA synthetase
MTHNDAFPLRQKIVWQPNPRWIKNSNLTRFMLRHDISDYDELYARSVNDIAWFWDAVIKDLNIQFYTPYQQVVDLSHGIQFPRWCTGAAMNIIHNCLDKWITGEYAHNDALIWEGEAGVIKKFSYTTLCEEVNRCANALRHLGIGKGDFVGLYMPMIPELAIAFLAIIKVGAIIIPLFSGFGSGAITTRLTDAHAKALFTTDGTWRRGKRVAMKENADAAVDKITSLKHMIVVNHIQRYDTPWHKDRDIWWHELIPNQSNEADTEITSAEDIIMLIYTSGTTGRPKGAVHTHCGFPIKAAQDMFYCMDVKPKDTMYWMSDMGWMMGPWEVFGTLLIGSTMVFYDGAPDYPQIDRLWSQVEKHRITHLGISPTLIRALKIHGSKQLKAHDLSSLRMVGSTGSPWDPESWTWLFKNVLHSRKPILNYSGGTEISGGIVCGNFFKALKPCAFSGPVPGMDADVVDEHGNSVYNQVGELVIRKPWIGMTRGFWNDKQRYLDTYWSRFDDVWLHGDFAAIDEDGLWYILGRSDDTIKIAGKRIGPAEIESILNSHEAVSESAVIGVPHDIKGEEVVAFCVLKAEYEINEVLRGQLLDLIMAHLGKALKPKEIKFIKSLPKTRNAKVMHRIIRATYLGNDPGDLSSLEDATAVDDIRAAR